MGPGVKSTLKRLLLNLKGLGNEQERRILALSVRLQTQEGFVKIKSASPLRSEICSVGAQKLRKHNSEVNCIKENNIILC